MINWNKGKNLTIKTIKKKQKHKARGAVRTITKQVPADSFFNFFNPPILEDGKEDIDIENILEHDYEIGHFLRSRIIPKALLYYTGELVDTEDEEYDEEEEEEEEDDDEDEEDEDEDASKDKFNKHAKPKPNPAECQQQ